MKLKPLVAMLAVLSTSAFADVDYSRCSFAVGLYGSVLNNDGQLKLWPNQKLLNKTTDGKIEKYTVESEMGTYNHNSYPPIKTQFTIERDDKGQVVKIITGDDKMDKKTIDSMKKSGLHMQALTAVMPYGFSNPNSYTNVFNQTGSEPVYPVKDKQGQISYKTLTQLTKDERSQVGLSEDLYKEMTQKWKKDKKSVAKIEKGLKHFQDNSKPSFPIGQEAEFDIKDGVCTPRVARQRYFNTADSSIGTTTTFTKEACEEVSKLYEKHKEKLAKCDETNAAVISDLMSSNDKIKDLYNTATYGLGGGLGVGYGYGYGMPGTSLGGGMYGGGLATGSQLALMKANCDAMVGKFAWTQEPSKTETKSSSSSQQ